jgi:hypothetical protein
MASCQDRHPAKLTVRLADDAGSPIAGYKVRASWYDDDASEATREAGGGWKKEVWTGRFAETDSSGLAGFDLRLWTNEVGFNLIQGLSGKEDKFYLTKLPIHRFERVENDRWIPENPVIDAVIKRKLKPIPMFAKSYTPGSSEDLWPPSVGKNYYYDFEVGAWVSPSGDGKSGDISFSIEYQESPNGDYHQTIRVGFPRKGDGLIAFERDLQTGSELVSDHEAPKDGYQPVVLLRRSSVNGIIRDDAKEERNYYFRVRTEVDAEGRIVSANYGKIYGDFMSFIYYFNPTPNDRNVEFDPSRNLFRGDSAAFDVTRP